MREEQVRVKSANDGAVAFNTPGRSLHVAADETVSTWADGSPIMRAEFDSILAPEKVFEIVEEEKASA